MHVFSSADVARRLMLIEKGYKWQFVVNRGDRLLSVAAALSVQVGEIINKCSLFLHKFLIQVLFLNINISAT